MATHITRDLTSDNIQNIAEIKWFDAHKKQGNAHKSYHYHNSYQIIIIERGYAEILVNSMICNLNAGMAIMLGSELAHGVNSFSDDVRGSLIRIPYTSLSWCNNIPELNKEAAFLRESQYGYIFTSMPLCRKAISLHRKIEKADGFQKVSYLFHLLQLFRHESEVKPFVVNHEDMAPKTQAPFQSAIERAYGYIYKHFQENFTLKDVAEFTALNSSALCRTFRRQSGLTIFEFVNRLRIEKACQLLRSTDMNITQIAFQVGYNTFSHFNTCFKRTVSLTPTQYRTKITSE